MTCWVVEQGLAPAGSCDGALIRAHLIAKSRMKRELHDVARDNVRRRRREQGWRKADLVSKSALALELKALVWDPRVWVPICGGPTGIGGHHGALDYAKTLRIPREKLPAGLLEFAAEYGLEWSLEADYGLEGVRHGL